MPAPRPARPPLTPEEIELRKTGFRQLLKVTVAILGIMIVLVVLSIWGSHNG